MEETTTLPQSKAEALALLKKAASELPATVTLTVTEQQIKEFEYRNNANCPIARAFKQKFPQFLNLHVDCFNIYVMQPKETFERTKRDFLAVYSIDWEFDEKVQDMTIARRSGSHYHDVTGEIRKVAQ